MACGNVSGVGGEKASACQPHRTRMKQCLIQPDCRAGTKFHRLKQVKPLFESFGWWRKKPAMLPASSHYRTMADTTSVLRTKQASKTQTGETPECLKDSPRHRHRDDSQPEPTRQPRRKQVSSNKSGETPEHFEYDHRDRLDGPTAASQVASTEARCDDDKRSFEVTRRAFVAS